MSPILYVPTPPESRPGGTPWDSLARYERAGRWAVSDSVSAALVRTLESASPVDSLALARALFHYANARLLRRQYADGRAFASLAQAMNIRARRMKPTDPLLIWGHVKAATIYSEAGHPDSARTHGEIGLQLLESMSPTDTSMLAQAHLGLATSLIALGLDAEARPHFEVALRLREQADRGEGILLVPILADYGGALSRAGEIDRARALLQRAVEISKRFTSSTSDYLENSLGRLSSFENRVGNIGESLALARQAYEVSRLRGESSIQALRARTVVAYRLQECGDPSGAALLLREILPGFEKSLGPNHPHTINARMSYIKSLVALGDTAGVARELAAARPVVALQDRRTNSNWVYWLALSGDLEGLRGNHAAARDSIQLAIDSERLRYDPFGARETGLLAGYLDHVRGPEDRESLDRAVSTIDRLRDSTLAPVSADWHLLAQSRAAAEARVGLRDSAWAHALEAERMTRERLAYQMEALSDLRGLQLARSSGGVSDLVVGLARPDHAGELETAWDRVVRQRGIVGREVARRRAPIAASTDTVLASAYGHWIASQRLLAQLVVSGAAHPGDTGSAARYLSARGTADAAEASYVLAARGRVAPDSAVGLERVRAGLTSDQALVSFAFGSDGSGETTLGAFVAIAGSKRVQWVPIGTARALDAALRPWVDCLGRPPANNDDSGSAERTCRDLGARVRDRTWDPIARAVGGAREILIVPEGPVIDLPWLALPTSGRSYLAESPVRVRVLWSERDVVPPLAAAPKTSGLLAVGDPAFDRAPHFDSTAAPALAPGLRAPPSPCIGSKGWELRALPAARAEAEGIARSWSEGGARVLLGEEADESRFKHEAPAKAVLHLATHGIMVQDTCRIAATLDTRGVGALDVFPGETKPKKGKRSRPSASPAPSRPTLEQPWLERQVWLALVGANRPLDSSGDENEGLLTAEEVVTLDLRGTDWVVLSACHSGYGQAWAREGVLGMRRAFHLAGAASVIASRWAVADESTREWMSELYAARGRGAHAAAATSEASRAVLTRRRAEHRTTHPFYWAAFSSIGE
ncbi:MAG: CHAT domain-containing protein [Candidatus Eiseniibacteriota bacterium]